MQDLSYKMIPIYENGYRCNKCSEMHMTMMSALACCLITEEPVCVGNDYKCSHCGEILSDERRMKKHYYKEHYGEKVVVDYEFGEYVSFNNLDMFELFDCTPTHKYEIAKCDDKFTFYNDTDRMITIDMKNRSVDDLKIMKFYKKLK